LDNNVACTSVRVDQSNNNVWVCDTSAKAVKVIHANGTADTVISLPKAPVKLEFDGQGYVWVACGTLNLFGGGSNTVEKIKVSTEARVTGGNFPISFGNAFFLAPDNNGNCWVSGTSLFGASMQCFQPNGAPIFTGTGITSLFSLSA